VIFEIFDETLETLPPYRVAIGMHRKTLSENGEKTPVQKPNELCHNKRIYWEISGKERGE
jgi:hypothetical protein